MEPSPPSRRLFYSNAGWQYAMQIARYAFPLVLIPFLTRTLGPQTFGVYAYVLALSTVAQVLIEYGFNLSGTRLMVRLQTHDQEEGLLGAITGARIVVAVLVGLGLFGGAHLIPILANNLWFTMLMCVAVALRSLQPDFVFMAKQMLRPLSTRFLISRALAIVLIVCFVRSPTDLWLIAIIEIISSFVALIWSFFLVNRMFHLRPKVVPLGQLLYLLRVSTPYCISNISSNLLNLLPTLMIGTFLSNANEIAYWSLAITVMGAAQSLYVPIVDSLYPHILVNKDFAFVRRIALWALPVVGVGTVGTIAASKWLMLILGGPAFVPGASAISFLAPTLFLSFYVVLFGWPVLGAAGEVNSLTLSTISAAVTMGGAGMILVASGNASLFAFAMARNASEAVLLGLRIAGVFRLRRRRRSGDTD